MSNWLFIDDRERFGESPLLCCFILHFLPIYYLLFVILSFLYICIRTCTVPVCCIYVERKEGLGMNEWWWVRSPRIHDIIWLSYILLTRPKSHPSHVFQPHPHPHPQCPWYANLHRMWNVHANAEGGRAFTFPFIYINIHTYVYMSHSNSNKLFYSIPSLHLTCTDILTLPHTKYFQALG